MLKGDFEIDIEFPMGTLIMMIVTILLIADVMLPAFHLIQNVYGSEGDVKAVEFSNFAKSKLEDRLGDGQGLDYEKITSFESGRLTQFGIADNYVIISDLESGESWEYGKQERRNQHMVYTTMEREYDHVIDGEIVVMEGGSEHLVHVYRIGESTVVDVYSDYICDPSGRRDGFPGKYFIVGCDDMEAAAGENVGKDYLTNNIILPVANGAEQYSVHRIVIAGDVSAGDMMSGTFSLGDAESCRLHSSEVICVRTIGKYVSPASIFVALQNDAEFISGGRNA